MNLTTASRTYQLLSRILDPRSATQPFLPPTIQHPAMPLEPVKAPFPRIAPESEGISSLHIRSFLEELHRGEDLYMQNVLILRHGNLLCEASFGPQDLRAAKHTFSACKSLTSLAIGLLVDDGLLSLQDKVEDLFEDLCTPAIRRKLKGMTVEDLLTMRSGVQFHEAEAMSEQDWERRFLSSSMKSDPAQEFSYTSLNTYMLSAIILRKTGTGLLPLLRERIFTPLEIEQVHWEKCPMGTEKGGWGLYIRPEDMAKLGQLVLNDGLWNGKRLISSEYLKKATAHHATPPETLGDYHYGYQIWVGRKEKSFLFNGMLGQNVLGFPDSGILILTNAGADTDYQESRYFEIVSRYFGGSFPDSLPEDADALSSLQDFVQELSWYNRPAQTPDPALFAPFLHRNFAAASDRAVSTGLLPLVLQGFHNNYTAGLLSVAISQRGNLPELIWRERDALYRFPVGLGCPIVTQLNFRGNVFQVAVTGRLTHDEEERPVFCIRLDFLETPCVRIIKLIRTRSGILLRQTETPGVPYVMNKLTAVAEQPLTKPLVLMSVGSTDPDYLLFKTQQIFSPEIPMVQKEL